MQFLQRFWKRWKTWGLPAFITALTPWFARLTEFDLISDFYQPRLAALATFFGATGAMVSVALLFDQLAAAKRKSLWRNIWVFVTGLLACLIFRFTVGQIWTFEPFGRIMVHIVWIAAYLAIFTSLGAIIAIAYLRIIEKPRRSGETGR